MEKVKIFYATEKHFSRVGHIRLRNEMRQYKKEGV